MKKSVLLFFVGLLVGSLPLFQFLQFTHQKELKKLTEELTVKKTVQAHSAVALKESESRLKVIEQTNRDLADKLQANSAESVAPIVSEVTATADDLGARRKEVEQAIKRSLERWTKALNLRPDQVAQLNQLIQSQLIPLENLSFRDISILQEALVKTLTTEQKKSYDHIQTREALARVEMRANMELSRVQSQFDLTESQKDQIFQKFAKLEQSSPAARDRESRLQMAEKRAELLQGILKPDQVKEYQETQSTRRGRGDGSWYY